VISSSPTLKSVMKEVAPVMTPKKLSKPRSRGW